MTHVINFVLESTDGSAAGSGNQLPDHSNQDPSVAFCSGIRKFYLRPAAASGADRLLLGM